MADKIAEKQESEINIRLLPLLVRDQKGKLLKPLSPNWQNVGKRITEDRNAFADELQTRSNNRGVLHIEVLEAENVNSILQKAGKIVHQSQAGLLPTHEDLKNFAMYLDWSYQRQVGVPANASNQEDAARHGIGAFDAWALFTSVKRRLENNG